MCIRGTPVKGCFGWNTLEGEGLNSQRDTPLLRAVLFGVRGTYGYAHGPCSNYGHECGRECGHECGDFGLQHLWGWVAYSCASGASSAYGHECVHE